MSNVDKCLFCQAELRPGSLEHAFPSSIGGRVATRRALCLTCNNLSFIRILVEKGILSLSSQACFPLNWLFFQDSCEIRILPVRL